ncbi:hypothetical protein BH10PLA1_BH10PLA1_09870 [soil metagenome]
MKSTSKWCLGIALSLAAACGISRLATADDAPSPAASTAVAGTEPLSPFGMGSCAARSRDPKSWVPQMAEIDVHVLRTPGGTGWKGVPRTDWTALDDNLKYFESQGAYSGGTFFSGRGKAKSGFPLDDLKGWTEFVTTMTAHTKGKIKYWELWNEPPNGTKNSPASDYAKYTVATYNAAKKGDPNCLIGLAAKSVHINYLDQAIVAGAKDHFDYITLHPYETLGCAVECPGAEPVFMSIVPSLRKMLAARNPSKINAPLWLTEVGSNAGKSGEDGQCRSLVKCYTMGIAQGMAVINWFEGRDGDSGPMGVMTADGTKRRSYYALGLLTKHLGLHPTYLGWVLLNDKSYGFVFKGAKSNVLITWARKGTTDDVDFGQPVEIIDTQTAQSQQSQTLKLTEDPAIIVSAPDTIVATATANKNKPFPWGGDYTNAKSISVTFGEKVEEKGLHTRAGEAVAADVVAYGGNARVGNLPGGQTFMVDPNFLSYTSTPIEIAIVCRLAPDGKPAKLSVDYESVNGMTKTAPYEIPDNKEWHTAKWTIKDSQFVSMYGFNFRIDKGTYYMQSVTITKLDK